MPDTLKQISFSKLEQGMGMPHVRPSRLIETFGKHAQDFVRESPIAAMS